MCEFKFVLVKILFIKEQILFSKIRDVCRPGKGLLGTRDKMPEIRDIPYHTGWVEILCRLRFDLTVQLFTNVLYTMSNLEKQHMIITRGHAIRRHFASV